MNNKKNKVTFYMELNTGSVASEQEVLEYFEEREDKNISWDEFIYDLMEVELNEDGEWVEVEY